MDRADPDWSDELHPLLHIILGEVDLAEVILEIFIQFLLVLDVDFADRVIERIVGGSVGELFSLSEIFVEVLKALDLQ